jgi:medium-chain acyl-[acyl-carrier-protein] hydrolase
MPTSSWYIRNGKRTQSAVRLFCFAYAGGSAAIFREWIDLLAPRVEVMAVELPGHGSRRDEEPFTAIEPLVEALVPALLPELNKPFAIFGHSLGALIGYEVARRLYTRTGLQPRRLFVAGHSAPGCGGSAQLVHNLPEQEFIAELRRLNGTPADILADTELMSLALPLLRADFRMNETYVHRSFPLLSCPVSAYGATADSDVSPEDISAWRKITKGPFSSLLFEGDHFFIHQATPLLVRQIELELAVAEGAIQRPLPAPGPDQSRS